MNKGFQFNIWNRYCKKIFILIRFIIATRTIISIISKDFTGMLCDHKLTFNSTTSWAFTLTKVFERLGHGLSPDSEKLTILKDLLGSKYMVTITDQQISI